LRAAKLNVILYRELALAGLWIPLLQTLSCVHRVECFPNLTAREIHIEMF